MVTARGDAGQCFSFETRLRLISLQRAVPDDKGQRRGLPPRRAASVLLVAEPPIPLIRGAINRRSARRARRVRGDAPRAFAATGGGVTRPQEEEEEEERSGDVRRSIGDASGAARRGHRSRGEKTIYLSSFSTTLKPPRITTTSSPE